MVSKFEIPPSSSDASPFFSGVGPIMMIHVHHFFLHRMAVFFEKMPPLALRVWDDFVVFLKTSGCTTGQNFSFEIRQTLSLGKHHYRLHMQDNSACLNLFDMFGHVNFLGYFLT